MVLILIVFGLSLKFPPNWHKSCAQAPRVADLGHLLPPLGPDGKT